MKKIILVLSLLCLCACTSNITPDNNTSGNISDTEKPAQTQAAENVIGQSDVDFSGYKTVVSEYSTDIDKNGDEDSIRLATNADMDKNGEIMWDDSNNWLLSVNVNGRDYEIFKGRVSGGGVSYNVYERTDGTTVISVTEEGTASYSVKQYAYSDRGFVQCNSIGDDCGNLLKTSLNDR